MSPYRRILRVLLSAPPQLILLMAVPSFAALIYVFLCEKQETVLAYLSYVGTAYVTTVISLHLPAAIRYIRTVWQTHPLVRQVVDSQTGTRYRTDMAYRAEISLYMSLAVNLVYAVLKTASGILYRSIWFGALAAYYLLLCALRFSLLHYVHHRRVRQNLLAEWKRYRLCGVILLVMNQALAVVVALVVYRSSGFAYPGTLIDEAFADEMLRVKNFIPAISVEGFEEDTDFRRGSGTFRKVERAMAILKDKKLPFGISCCYTSKNVHMIGSEAYFDQMIAWGTKFCWFFTYMPVGNAAVPELMVTPEQRKFMYEQVRKFRASKPLFTLDFWNDGEYAGGCVAGGRRYLHINAGGDMEPCAFVHYSDANIREKSLLDALKSPLFMAYHNAQPFNGNHLRPCPLLDNPQKLRDMVHTSGAHSTDMESPEDVDKLTAKCDGPAERWAVVADDLWKCSGHCAHCQDGCHTIHP